MLRARVLTAAILAGMLLVGLFLLPARVMALLFGVMFTLGAWEWSAFCGSPSRILRGAYTAVIAALMGAGWLLTRDPVLLVPLLTAACLWWLVAFLWLALAPERQRPGVTLVCGAFVLVPSYVALARLLEDSNRGFSGAEIVLGLWLLVIAADIGAFFAGRNFGRLKLAPRVSPGKTWEGAIGGMALVMVVCWAAALRFHWPVLASVMFGAALCFFSIVGDLTESMFKRSAGLKDSGHLLPGHGGVLDRLDSIAAAAPLYALGFYGYRAFA